MTHEDRYQWLEEVTGEDALDWVQKRNAETLSAHTQDSSFTQLKNTLHQVLDADDRIPYVIFRGKHLYNFWQDATHVRGLWRRTTLESYRSNQPEWELVLDIDALAKAENENWVWQGATVLRPSHQRALLKLSRGGADAIVMREFDLETLEFVEDGFSLPESKSRVSWIDLDRIYVGTDFGPDSMTNSGYPRLAKEWQRGTPLSAATLVFEGNAEDVAITALHDSAEGYERDLMHRSLDFYRSETYAKVGSEFRKIEIPEDASFDTHHEWLLIHLRSEWTVAGTVYPAGSLLAANFDDFVDGDYTLVSVFEPNPHTSLESYDWTQNYLILTILTDVKTIMRVLTPGSDTWTSRALEIGSPTGTAEVISTTTEHGDEYLINSSGFIEPATLIYGKIGETAENTTSEVLKKSVERFDSSNFSVAQHFATSLDGTQIPYFVVQPSAKKTGPTLLTGYGGYEVSMTPYYSGMIGKGWLARGGTYVVANIRGGGEYGPEWHSQAVKANRHRVYEDFGAVATDLIERGITTPETLGIQGGSNGGLLMGVMLTHYPHLFGAIACQVPLLDMRRYHQLLAGASWMAEYGDPDNPEEWAFIKKHSPYHNVQSGQKYPPTLFVTSTRDDRVHPAHARKMVAKMLDLGYSPSYYENIEGGHGAAADNEQLAFKSALVYEFLWHNLTAAK